MRLVVGDLRFAIESTISSNKPTFETRALNPQRRLGHDTYLHTASSRAVLNYLIVHLNVPLFVPFSCTQLAYNFGAKDLWSVGIFSSTHGAQYGTGWLILRYAIYLLSDIRMGEPRAG